MRKASRTEQAITRLTVLMAAGLATVLTGCGSPSSGVGTTAKTDSSPTASASSAPPATVAATSDTPSAKPTALPVSPCPAGVQLPQGVDPVACGPIPPNAQKPTHAGQDYWGIGGGYVISSPSGNIGCDLTTSKIACSVLEHSFAVPKDPDKNLDGYCANLELGSKGKSEVLCRTGTMGYENDPPQVLGYQKSVVLGSFVCLSQEAGMTCWNAQTGHGLLLSKTRMISW